MNGVPRLIDESLAAVVDQRFRDSRGEPVPDRVADSRLVDIVSKSLRQSLTVRRMQGLSGWHVKPALNEKLIAELHEHVLVGSMVDVIRVASVIYARSHLYGAES